MILETESDQAIGTSYSDKYKMKSGGKVRACASAILLLLAWVALAPVAISQVYGGNMLGTTLSRSDNSQIDVMAPPYEAKGDCISDDRDAIMRAQTAALAYQSGNTGPATLYFPKPPGGCYLTSTIQWAGVSMIGQPSGTGSVSPVQYGVTIKGKPGQDILHVPDPTTTAFTWNNSWTLRDISFVVDDRTNPTFPHRWPGRWFDDGAMTSGSNVFATSFGQIGCGDIGQAIQVNGAGPGGANLVTTISNVTPCWANGDTSVRAVEQTVTLAANASTTVTNAHSYIAVLGESVTKTVSNCAIAMDMIDAKAANWVNPDQVWQQLFKHRECEFQRYWSNWANPVCAIYTQGNHILYALRVRNFGIYSSSFGVVQGPSELNSDDGSDSGDFEVWENGFIQNFAPWISYNGIDNTLRNIELTVDAGPQILQLSNISSDVASGWHIHLPEMEPGGAETTYGMRLTGTGHVLENTLLLSTPLMTGIIDTIGIICHCGQVGANQLIYGANNKIDGFTHATDLGRGNVLINPPQISSLPGGLPINHDSTPYPLKDRPDLIGAFDPDFLSDGNLSVPYKHTDMWLIPQDAGASYTTKPYTNTIVADAAATFGYEFVWGAGTNLESWTQFPGAGGTQNMIVGTNVPAGPITIYARLKCQTASSTFHFHVNTTSGYVGGYEQAVMRHVAIECSSAR